MGPTTQSHPTRCRYAMDHPTSPQTPRMQRSHQCRQKIPRCWQRTPIHPNHRWFSTRCLETTKHPATPTKEVNSIKNLVKLLKILNFNICSKMFINLLCRSCHLRSKVTQKNKLCLFFKKKKKKKKKK